MAPDWFDEGANGHAVDVEKTMDSDAAPLIWGLVAAGALVSLGTTSDGGALACTVTLDGRWRRTYVRDSDELVLWLTDALTAVTTVGRVQPASSGNGRSARRR
jgi:hypothetical protein